MNRPALTGLTAKRTRSRASQSQAHNRLHHLKPLMPFSIALADGPDAGTELIASAPIPGLAVASGSEAAGSTPGMTGADASGDDGTGSLAPFAYSPTYSTFAAARSAFKSSATILLFRSFSKNCSIAGVARCS